MKLDYTVQVWREGRHFIAHAMPLDVASSGPTVAAAQRALDEAVRLFLSTADEQGTLPAILQEAGYRKHGRAWSAPEWVGVEQRTCLAAV